MNTKLTQIEGISFFLSTNSSCIIARSTCWVSLFIKFIAFTSLFFKIKLFELFVHKQTQFKGHENWPFQKLPLVNVWSIFIFRQSFPPFLCQVYNIFYCIFAKSMFRCTEQQVAENKDRNTHIQKSALWYWLERRLTGTLLPDINCVSVPRLFQLWRTQEQTFSNSM